MILWLQVVSTSVVLAQFSSHGGNHGNMQHEGKEDKRFRTNHRHITKEEETLLILTDWLSSGFKFFQYLYSLQGKMNKLHHVWPFKEFVDKESEIVWCGLITNWLSDITWYLSMQCILKCESKSRNTDTKQTKNN